MKMKKILTAAAVCAMAVGVATTAEAATELKWGSVHPDTAIVTQMMQKAIEEINENAEDSHITGYPNGALGGSQDLVAMNGEYKDTLNKEFESVNTRILGTFYYGTRQLTTDKEIHTLDDLKGLKIRVPESDLYVKMVESWGAAATPMNINDLYMALQTGTVDGQENPLTTFDSYKFYEVVKNVILTNHIICPNMVFINNDVWNNMSEHDQEVVQTAINNAIAWQDEQVISQEKELQKTLADEDGCTIITPDDTIREATIPVIQPLVDDWDLIQSYADGLETTTEAATE